MDTDFKLFQPVQQNSDPLASAWAETEKAPQEQMEDMFSRAWNDGDLNEADLNKVWQQMMAQAQSEGYDYEAAWDNSNLWNTSEQKSF